MTKEHLEKRLGERNVFSSFEVPIQLEEGFQSFDPRQFKGLQGMSSLERT